MEKGSELQYNLSQSIEHHKKTLRSITSNEDGVVVTGSYDQTCAFFGKQGKLYALLRDTHYHTDMVYIVRAVQTGFLSGSKDTRIILMDKEEEFVGHTGVVNSFSQADSDLFISGSWDATARVWDINTGESKFVLKGHSYAVSVLALGNNKYITGSQDKVLRFWDKDQNYKNVNDAHGDIIRDIIRNNDNESFYTCSNDCTIKKWNYFGQLLTTLTGHEGFIFRLFKWKNYLFSAGDDKLVKIWKDDVFIQDLMHPNTIWDLTVNENGDLLTDGVLRFFSSNEEEWLPQDKIDEYYDLCLFSNQADQESSNEHVDVNKLPKISTMYSINAKEGEIRVFNENEIAVAYVYANGKWDIIGNVLGTKAGKKEYPGDGVFPAGEYDFIFNVEIAGNSTTLPFNKGDNALVAAEKFCAREGIHRNNIDDITRFLRENSKSQPSTFNKSNTPTNRPPVRTKPTLSVKLPKTTFIIYDSINVDGPIKKIFETNDIVSKENPDLALSSLEIDMVKTFLKTVKETHFYHTSSFNEKQLSVFFEKLGSWKVDNSIPFLDCFRMFLLHPRSQDMFKKLTAAIYEYTRIMETFKNGGDVHRILILRILSNMFINEQTQNFIKSKRSDVLETVSNLLDSENKNIKSGLVALLFNYSIVLNSNDSEGALQVLSLILMNDKDPKNLINGLFTIANLTHNNEGNTEICKDMEILSSINDIDTSGAEEFDLKLINEFKNYFSFILK